MAKRQDGEKNLPANTNSESTLLPITVIVDGQGALDKLASSIDLFMTVAVIDIGLSPAVILCEVVLLAGGQLGSVMAVRMSSTGVVMRGMVV